MKRIHAGFIFSFLALSGFLLGGCSESAKTEKITIRGSNTIGEELVPRLIAEYKKEHPGVTFDTEFKGSAYGFGALMAGLCDIAASSREASMNELRLARDRAMEFNHYIIGTYSVSVILNAANPVTNLTLIQVRDLFTGAIQNWKEVGGPDAPVSLYIRDPISGTHLGFRELAIENKPYALNVKTFTNYDGIVHAVAKDPNAVGYCNLVAMPKEAKAVAIGGVAPVVFSVNEGKYPYARVLRLCTDKAKESTTARDFINFVKSQRGQEIVAQVGDVPRP